MKINMYSIILIFLFSASVCGKTYDKNEIKYIFQPIQPVSLVEMIDSLKDTIDLDEKWQQRMIIRNTLEHFNFSPQEKLSATVLSITKHRRELMSLVLADGVDVHAKAEHVHMFKKDNNEEISCEWAPLCFATFEKDSLAIKMLVEHGAGIRDLTSSDGFLRCLENNMGRDEKNQLLGLVHVVEQKKQEDFLMLPGLDDLGQ